VQPEPYDSQTQKRQTVTFILNSNNKLPWHFISSRYQMNSLSEQLTN
jgi:cytochrome c oxidase assembly protein Cox11